jgi:cyanophycin synthetase
VFLLIDDFTSFNTKATARMTRDKHLTKQILAYYRISVPHGIISDIKETVESEMQAQGVHYPVVVKPLDAAKGTAVSVGIDNKEALYMAIERINNARDSVELMQSDKFLVEEMVYGNDYRVLILDGEVIACAQRIPAFILGDGVSAVQSLIEEFNKNRPDGYQIDLDEDLLNNLKSEGIDLSHIVENGIKISLRNNANISSGGRAIDYTDTMSDRFKDICIRAANVVGGVFVGIDIFVDDITLDNNAQEYAIIEINGAPDYDIHEKPVIEGDGVNVTELLLSYIYIFHTFDLSEKIV